MSEVPFMQLYVGDYLADTRHLTTEQHGAYLLLLMTMWKAGGKLPNDPAKLARIAGVSLRRWHLIWPEIAAFFDDADGFVTQNRLVREYRKAVSKREKRCASGSLGGKAKALNAKGEALANATVSLKHSSEPEPESYKAPASQEQPAADLTDREMILEAMGHPPSGLTATGRIVGNPADMLEAQRWRTELGLSLEQIVGVISELAARPTYRPPRSFGYFREAMRDRAGLLSQTPLTPITQPTQAVKIDWTRYGLPPD
jgi:uncharacterized protein YdaU (DUF1376 family)